MKKPTLNKLCAAYLKAADTILEFTSLFWKLQVQGAAGLKAAKDDKDEAKIAEIRAELGQKSRKLAQILTNWGVALRKSGSDLGVWRKRTGREKCRCLENIVMMRVAAHERGWINEANHRFRELGLKETIAGVRLGGEKPEIKGHRG